MYRNVGNGVKCFLLESQSLAEEEGKNLENVFGNYPFPRLLHASTKQQPKQANIYFPKLRFSKKKFFLLLRYGRHQGTRSVSLLPLPVVPGYLPPAARYLPLVAGVQINLRRSDRRLGQDVRPRLPLPAHLQGNLRTHPSQHLPPPLLQPEQGSSLR